MRIEEVGYVTRADAISPEAFKAQRLAELEQIAKWRYKRMKIYQAWSDPEKRERLKQQSGIDLDHAKDLANGMKIPWVSKGKDGPDGRCTDWRAVPIYKEPPSKAAWYQRLYKWLF